MSRFQSLLLVVLVVVTAAVLSRAALAPLASAVAAVFAHLSAFTWPSLELHVPAWVGWAALGIAISFACSSKRMAGCGCRRSACSSAR